MNGTSDQHETRKLEDLPADIILSILPYLEPRDFLTFCSTSKAFTALGLSPSYWRHVARSTYRFPNQPLLQTDGARWKSLYQRMQTECRAYTWGSSSPGGYGGLGHAPRPGDNTVTVPRYGLRFGVAWPTEMDKVGELDPIVDLQCGGWSTTVLTSAGDLYSAGELNGHAAVRKSNPVLGKLAFPWSWPSVTIAQFSSGRSHILALSDSGTIWVWKDVKSPARPVEFLHLDEADGSTTQASERSSRLPRGITRVVAGWASSSAFVAGKGIVSWDMRTAVIQETRPEEDEEAQPFLVDDALVPDTYYQRPKRKARHMSADEEELGKRVGEVVNHVVLEGYIVFITDLGKVFGVKHGSQISLRQGIFELSDFGPSEGKPQMSEIQGSFRSFAVFNTGGDVVLGDCDLLDEVWRRNFGSGAQADSLLPLRPPALQNKGIISVVFGDWHRLALTYQGHILSFGNEPSTCGCLGLGTSGGEGLLRGLRYTRDHWTSEADSQGRWRRIWFSPEQREWLRYMVRGGVDTGSGLEQIRRMINSRAHFKVVDWFEDEGADWDLHPDLDDDSQPWGHFEPAYFGLSIAAAGWHSGALVLKNEKKVRRMYAAHTGFLPPVNMFEPVPTGFTTLLSWLWKYLTSWLIGASYQNEPPRFSPTEDQQQGRDHPHYHSEDPWIVSQKKLPDAGKHEVYFPQISVAEPQHI